MKHQRLSQQIDRSHPAVQQFTKECGLTEHAVSIRLIGVTRADVETQIERLNKAFGELLVMTQPRQTGKGVEWIAYGTIIG